MNQNIPDSFGKQTILQEVLQELRKEGFVPAQDVLDTLNELNQIVEELGKRGLQPDTPFTKETFLQYREIREGIVQEVLEELRKDGLAPDTPAPLERFAIRADIENKLNDFDIARSDLISHCFKMMLSEGISWKDIMGEIASLIPGSDQEAMRHLQELESLTLTASDFP